MKSIVLLVSTLVLGGTIFGQITVTQWNIAGQSDVVIQNHDTIPSVSAPTSGTNQVWDYSTGLVAHNEDTLSFANPAWLNNGSYFPSSNLAAVQGGMEIYLINDASSLRSIGFAGDIFGTGDKQFYMNPAEEMIRFPANYNDAYNTNSMQKVVILGSDLGLPVDSIVMKEYKTKDVMIDGWGSISTPYGTFAALRQNETAYTVDSTWTYIFGMESLVDNGADTSYNYSFWSDDPSARFPVMEMSHDNAGTVYSVSWLKEAPSADLNSLELDNGFVYPNPASNLVTIEFASNEVAFVTVYTSTGALVASAEVSNQTTTIDISKLNDGVYYFKAMNASNEVVESDKFVVKK